MYSLQRDGDPVVAVREILAAATDRSPAARALAVALSGWGYDFHNRSNVIRSNDILVRQRVSAWLRETAAAFEKLERTYAREIPSATREHPFPSAQATRTVRGLRGQRALFQDLAARVDALETPAGDRIWNRFSNERILLQTLIELDVSLLVFAQTVRANALALDLTMLGDVSEVIASFEPLVRDIESRLRERSDLLLV